jgi:predicted nucleotidyltransferase
MDHYRTAMLPGGAVLREPATSVRSRKASEVVEILRNAAPRLREMGIKHISLFGSTACGTHRSDSDIDLLLDLDERQKIDLLDYAGIVAEIQKLVPQHVDLALRNTLKSHVAVDALPDEIRVF